MKILSFEQLEKLTTKRLLAYKNKLMQVPETPYWDDPKKITKSSPEWKVCYRALKKILSKRENVE